MPARSERVYVCPNQSGQPCWIADFPEWWDRSGFFQRYGERQIDTGNLIYVDFGLLLTLGEALAWDTECRAAFAGNPLSREPAVIAAMQRWETMLKSASWIIVESYEWESGLE